MSMLKTTQLTYGNALGIKANHFLLLKLIDFYLHLMKREMDLENQVLVLDHFVTWAILERQEEIQVKQLMKKVN